jgi:hypothetical protein
MTQSFFVCYSGTDRYGNTHMPYKAVVHTADEAIAVINTWKTYGKKDSTNEWEQIKVNAQTEKKIREYFANGVNVTWDGYKTDHLSVRTTGCGCWDIIIRPALADTLEEHDRIYNEQREAAKQERMRQAEIVKQERLAELNEQRKGWYHVELDLRLSVFAQRGNDYFEDATFTGNIIADSGMDAYNKAVKHIKDHPEELETNRMKHRGDWGVLQSWADMTSGGYDFAFLGVKTDEGYSVDKWNEWKEKGEI